MAISPDPDEEIRITSVAWTDGDFVEEKINFKCQHLEILYKPQAIPVNLAGKVPLVDWTWSDRAQQKSQGGQ